MSKTNSKKRTRKHLYTSKGAHLAVMSELLCLGWNVAIPEVDVGDDIFVVSDKPVLGATRQFFTVQVKYNMATERSSGNYGASFDIPTLQLETTPTTANDLVYILVPRFKGKWASFFVIKRYDLYSLHDNKNNPIGYRYCNVKSKKEFLRVNFYFDISKNTVECSGVDISKFLNSWEPFPEINDP